MIEYSVAAWKRYRKFDTSAADVWRLGVILSMMFTKRNNFYTGSPFEKIITMNEARRYSQIGVLIGNATPPVRTLLARIFAPPNERISIDELFREVQQINVFLEGSQP